MYIATINTPGYLPWQDEPELFENTAEAWEYLAEERNFQVDDETAELLDRYAAEAHGVDTVYGVTPGYEGFDDRGLAYSVSVYVREEGNVSWEHNLAGDPYRMHWKAERHKVRTRVRFKDGSEEIRYGDDNSAKAFREAILLAEHERGEDHAGAWQEYRAAGWE